ncbi:MAG: hypothetical protein CALGDGBN_02331 [Pseudomonadales bacterium]|nr:hypothetical protein [Pseudomonadales bacterium]
MVADSKRRVTIVGVRGIPAAHGGFETFAEHLALYLVRQGWVVTVYCQEDGRGATVVDNWRAVRRVRVPVDVAGPVGTMLFDAKCIWHSAKAGGLILTLGYNTAVFCIVYRLFGRRNIINMDGIEWRRKKWGPLARLWFWINDWAGCWVGNHLIADHPGIRQHLLTRVRAPKVTMIPYGAHRVDSANVDLIEPYGLHARAYAILIARAEPENSVLEVVSAWSSARRGLVLVVLGSYDDRNSYHCRVKAAASNEVFFLGAIYDSEVVQSLRYFARFYIHGHQVGGTNPSLVEALGAGNAVLAHDNEFNRWVAGDAALYFSCERSCSAAITSLIESDEILESLSEASVRCHAARFGWGGVLSQYEDLLSKWVE